jgi:hypothetical protein
LVSQKISTKQYKEEKKEVTDMLYQIHFVMDYYSNEFMRVENFLEKYLPLKVQNQISSTLTVVLPGKDRGRLREYEDHKFLELRENLILDKGLPDLEKEVDKIVNNAKDISQQFTGFEGEKPEF